MTRPAATRASTCLVDTTTLRKRDSNVTALMELELVWSCRCRHKQRVNKNCHGNTTQRFPDLPTVLFKGQWLVLVFHSSILTRLQASRIEILNDDGLRSDGRRQYELRDITIDFSLQGHADASVTFQHGLTQVLVSVLGPHEAKMRSQTIHDRAVINVEVSVAAFSTGERQKRSRGDKYVHKAPLKH